MQELRVKFIENIKRTATVRSFRFIPQENIVFQAGQFLQLIFDPANRANNDLNKYLSFSSAPGKGYFEVTKRLSESNFSKQLRSLKPGDEVLVKVPLGSCAFKEEYQRIAFLIGGIGITPVIAIIEHIAARKIATDTVLIYSNRTEEEIAFKKELDSWQVDNKNIKIFYTVSDSLPRDNRYIRGRIDKELLSVRLPDIKERIIFIFGPPKMVEAMQQLCLGLGCNKEKIKTESFLGY